MNSSNDISNEKLKKAMNDLKENNTIETTGAFLNVLLNSKLLVPMKISKENGTIDENGIRTLQSGTELKFKSVVNTENDAFLITFTDWAELKSWDNENKEAILIDYFEILEIIMKENSEYAGFVINPFSHNHVLNKKSIQAINRAIS